MHILILTPTTLPSITGNAITAERWRRSLQGKGIGVTVMGHPEPQCRRLPEQAETHQTRFNPCPSCLPFRESSPGSPCDIPWDIR